MSIFRCAICDIDFDSDYHEMFKVDDFDVCEECYLDQIKEGGLE